MPFIVAIDGPAGAGKGTLAKALAARFHFAFMDTGLLYRSVAMKAFAASIPLDDENRLESIALNITNPDLMVPGLRDDFVAAGASIVSAFPRVRAALLTIQRQFASNPGDGYNGVILDGRDIGTHICPDATVKLYVTADVSIRAIRRQKELQNRGMQSIYTDVLKDMMDRDRRDGERLAAPLKASPDACIIDTTHLSPNDALNKAIGIIQHHRSFCGGSDPAKNVSD